jgi:hypothetical protein
VTVFCSLGNGINATPVEAGLLKVLKAKGARHKIRIREENADAACEAMG